MLSLLSILETLSDRILAISLLEHYPRYSTSLEDFVLFAAQVGSIGIKAFPLSTLEVVNQNCKRSQQEQKPPRIVDRKL